MTTFSLAFQLCASMSLLLITNEKDNEASCCHIGLSMDRDDPISKGVFPELPLC